MVPRTYLTLFSLLLILSQGVFQCITHYLRDKFIFIICVPGDAQEFYIILLHPYNKPIITLFSFPKIEIGFDHIQSLTYYCRSTSALYNSTIQVFKTSVPHNPVQIPHQCLLPQSFPRLKQARQSSVTIQSIGSGREHSCKRRSNHWFDSDTYSLVTSPY